MKNHVYAFISYSQNGIMYAENFYDFSEVFYIIDCLINTRPSFMFTANVNKRCFSFLYSL